MYAFAFLRKRNPIRMQSRGCTYTIRKNVEGNGTAWVAALGNDRGYDDDLHPISPVIVALRGNIALQRKKLGRSVEEVTPHTPQKSQQAMKIDNPATKWTPATAHHRELQRAGAWPGPSSSHRKRAPCHSCNSDRSEPALLRSIRSQRSVQASSDVKSQNTVITSAARDLLFLRFWLPLLRLEHTISHRSHLRHLRHVVHAHDVRTTQDAGGDGCRSRKKPPFRRHGALAPQRRELRGRAARVALRLVESAFLGESQRVAKESFARSANKERITEPGDLREAPQQFIILRKAFTEADTWVEHDLRFRNAGFSCNRQRRAKILFHVSHDVFREWNLLHRRRLAAHVHQNEPAFFIGNNVGDARIVTQRRNVIDDFRARTERNFSDRGFSRV